MVRLLIGLRLGAAGLLAAWGALLAQPAAAGDALAGKADFARICSVCHSAARGGAPILGPTLFGVVDRKAGSVKGYNYSDAMSGAGFTWTADRLRTYLAAPGKIVPGTKMTFAGVKNPTQIDDLIAYLETLK